MVHQGAKGGWGIRQVERHHYEFECTIPRDARCLCLIHFCNPNLPVARPQIEFEEVTRLPQLIELVRDEWDQVLVVGCHFVQGSVIHA